MYIISMFSEPKSKDFVNVSEICDTFFFENDKHITWVGKNKNQLSMNQE